MLKRILYRLGIGYEPFGVSESEFWQIAARHIPFSYRWFSRSLSLREVDAELHAFPPWENLRPEIQSGDRICPFEINPDTSALRRGYVVMRGNAAIGGVVIEVS